jgi:hypothetical protein
MPCLEGQDFSKSWARELITLSHLSSRIEDIIGSNKGWTEAGLNTPLCFFISGQNFD